MTRAPTRGPRADKCESRGLVMPWPFFKMAASSSSEARYCYVRDIRSEQPNMGGCREPRSRAMETHRNDPYGRSGTGRRWRGRGRQPRLVRDLRSDLGQVDE